jgi:outer membrane protein OmpA-like peptidoglycan-associated protein
MKTSPSLFYRVIAALLFLLSFQVSDAQLLKRIKNEVKHRAQNKIVNGAGNATDKAIDNTVDAVTGKNKGTDASSNDVENSTTEEISKAKPASIRSYKNYDFVAGDKIIFQPDLSSEADAELPARFIVKSGNAEIQSFEGEKILHLQADGHATVAPLMNSEKYLPEQYTLEFDMMWENDASYFKYVSQFDVNFRKPEDQNYRNSPFYKFTIYGSSASTFGNNNASRQNFPKEVTDALGAGNSWHHIAIYVRKNIGKAYIDQYRVFATNTLPVGATKVDLKADRYGIKIKNFRLAAGGDDKYNKIVTDGKFITHGILFDVNKSSIKPESMGALNEISKLMKEHSDLKFEIDGHTDSDGNEDANMKLSESRAAAVKDQLVKMGIDESRLTTKGFGETKPIDKNDSAEGKANNRRVEFVKI